MCKSRYKVQRWIIHCLFFSPLLNMYFTVPSQLRVKPVHFKKRHAARGMTAVLKPTPVSWLCHMSSCFLLPCKEPGCLKESDAVYCLEILWKVMCCHENSPQKCSLSLAVSPSTSYDLTLFYFFGAESLFKCVGWFLSCARVAIPADPFWVVLLCCSARSHPFSLTSPAALISCSLLPCWLSVTFTVSTELFPWYICLCPVSCSLRQCCGLLFDLPARLQGGCRGRGGSSLWGFQLQRAELSPHPAGKPFTAAPLQTHHSTSLPLPPV